MNQMRRTIVFFTLPLALSCPALAQSAPKSQPKFTPYLPQPRAGCGSGRGSRLPDRLD